MIDFQFSDDRWHLWQDDLMILGSGQSKSEAIDDAIKEQGGTLTELHRMRAELRQAKPDNFCVEAGCTEPARYGSFCDRHAQVTS